MALRFQQVTLPVAGGLGDVTSRFVRTAVGGAPPLEAAENCEHTRLGALAKRHGFTSLTTTTVSGTISGARLLCSAGDSLTLVDGRRAWRYSAQLSRWMDRGPVGPGGLRYAESIGGARSYDDADIASNGTYTIVAAGATYDEFTVNTGAAPDTLDSTTFDVVRVMVLDSDGVVILPATDFLNTSTDATRRRSIRCSSTGTKLLMAAQVALTSPARNLEIREWDPSSPTATPSVAQTISNTFAGTRTYDIIRVENSGTAGEYIVAYIDSATQDVELERYSSTHVAGVSATITEDAEGVAICEGSDGNIYVAVITADGVNLYSRDADLTADWGPVAQYTFVSDGDAATETGNGIGVVTDSTDIAVTFNVTHSGLRKSRLVAVRARESDGAVLDIHSAYNCAATSRPWIQDSRFYVAGQTFSYRYPYDCGVVWEVYAKGTNPITGDGQPSVAAAFHMGTTSRVLGNMGAGNVFTAGNVVTWLGFPYTRADAEQDTTASQVGEPRTDSLVGVEVVSLDFDSAITCTQTAADEMVLGSSLVTFLGSSVTQELGWIVPPVLRNDAQLGSTPVIFQVAEGDDLASLGPVDPGLTASGDETWTAIWSFLDSDGVLHRSHPAPPQTLTQGTNTANKKFYCSMRAKTTGASNRLINQDATVEWYRGEATVFRLVPTVGGDSDNPVYAPNEGNSQYHTEEVIDFGATGILEPLYTTGGVLENVAPAGADVAAVVRDRLWLGGARRVQYSKPLAPAVAGGLRVAPEMNEGFALQLPGGERCTGIAGLDGRPIVFTDKSIFAVVGAGPNNVGAGGTFELSATAADEGCKDPRSVVGYPDGIFFQGARGIYELGRNLQASFIGSAVIDQTDAYPVVTSAVLVAAVNQVRFTVHNAAKTDGRVLVYDYLAKAWTTWHLRQSGPATTVPVSACLHNGVYHVLDSSGTVWYEDSTTYLDDTNVWVPLKVRTSQMQGAGLNGWQRVGRVTMLGKHHEAHNATMRLYHDFATSSTQSYTWETGAISSLYEISVREQLEMLNARQECTAIAVEIEDDEPTAPASPGTGQGLELFGFSLELGIERGGALLPPGAR